FLRWRYGTAPLAYRALLAGPRVEDGMVIFRVRPRGRLHEVVICDVLAPPGAERGARALVRRLVRAPDMDLAIRLDGPVLSPEGFIRAPGGGWPVIGRSLADEPMPDRRLWSFTLGDLELF